MSFIVRSANKGDLSDLYDLSKQFVLLNLPSDKRIIEKKIEQSVASFGKKIKKEEARYLFVGIDTDTKKVVGCSQIIGQKGRPSSPNYSFKLIKKEKFSPDLSVGFIHQLLRLNIDTDGPTEIGGLIVDKNFRRRPEKAGKMLSLSRFSYMALEPTLFKPTVLSEMAPPLTEDGRSEFWEALGRRFTGMPYQEADQLSSRNKDFIKSLFPEEDIYTCLLESKARLVMGQVSQETQPALKFLIDLGFNYNYHIDPFDGGPHVEAPREEISIIKNGNVLSVKKGAQLFEQRALVGHVKEGEFYGALLPCSINGPDVCLPQRELHNLKLETGDKIFVSAMT